MLSRNKSGLLAALGALAFGFIHATAQEPPGPDPDTGIGLKPIEEKSEMPADGVEEPAPVNEVPASETLQEPTPAVPVAEENAVLPLIEPDPSVGVDPYWTPELAPVSLPLSGEDSLVEFASDDLSAEAPATEEEETAASPFATNSVFRDPGTGAGNAAYTFDGRPTGFNNAPVIVPSGKSAGKRFKGFDFSTNLTGTYNSNVTQASDRPGDPVTGDFILGLGGTVSYLSSARVWTFGGNYSGSYDQYFDNGDFSGFNQSGGLVANYDGGKLSATFNTGLTFGRGGNRNYVSSSFVEQLDINSNLSVRYAYSAKTSVTADAGYSFTTASGGNFNDTSSSNLGFSALWKYSPLTEFGPGIRYTGNYGGGNNDRTTIGPTLTLNYKLSSKVSLNSKIGLDFADYSNGGSADATSSALIGLNYNASSLWGMNLSLYRDARADASVPGAFTEVTSLRLGYNRKIRRATFGLGLGYEVSTTENSSSVIGGGRPDRDYFTFDTSLGMAVFRNTTQASVFYRYSDQSAGAIESFDSSQVGFSLSRGF